MSEKRELEEPTVMQVYRRIKLASPSPEREGTSDTESILSCQGYETELVKDTSDTSTSPSHNIEFELTDSEKPNEKFFFISDSDDYNNVFGDKIIDSVSSDSLDTALLGDTSEENSTSPTSNSDVDPGLPRSDYLDFERCLLCQTDQKNISYPYCSTCFSLKKSFFPDRPKKRQKIVKLVPKPKPERSNETDISSSEDERNSARKNSANQESSEGIEDSGLGSSNPQSSEDVVDGPSQPRCEEEDVPPQPEPSTSGLNGTRLITTQTCRVCYQKPENGLFLHKHKVHLYGCYSCANKIWWRSRCCPICRGKCFKVARLFP